MNGGRTLQVPTAYRHKVGKEDALPFFISDRAFPYIKEVEGFRLMLDGGDVVDKEGGGIYHYISLNLSLSIYMS